MNPNQSAPDPFPGSGADLNDNIMKSLNASRWWGRTLAAMALSLGLLAIAVGILIAWANLFMIMPMQRLLLQDYPFAVAQTNVPGEVAINPEGRAPLSKAELDWRHVQVTAGHGKAMFLISASVAFLGAGTFVTLLLVILNRRATLRQVNASLAQISRQIQELSGNKGAAGSR